MFFTIKQRMSKNQKEWGVQEKEGGAKRNSQKTFVF
jgi:hypothetical protein